MMSYAKYASCISIWSHETYWPRIQTNQTAVFVITRISKIAAILSDFN